MTASAPETARASTASSQEFDIPVDDYGNRHRLLDGTNRDPIGGAVVELATGAPVDGDELDPSSLGAAREIGRVHGRGVPAKPHFQGHRDTNGGDRRLDQTKGMIKVPHKRRAGRPIGDLLGGATHVDIDDVGALRLGNPGPFRHPMRLASRKLDDVDFDAPPVAAHRCLPFAANKAGACGHFGHDEAGTQPLGQPAERRIGNSGHGRQNHAVRRLRGADVQPLGRKVVVFQCLNLHAYHLGDYSRCPHFSQSQWQSKCCTAKNCSCTATQDRCVCGMEITR